MTKYYMRQRRRSTSPIGRLAEYTARQSLAAADPALYARLYAPQQYKQLLRWQAIGDYMGSYLGGGKSTPLAITSGQGGNVTRLTQERTELKQQLMNAQASLAAESDKVRKLESRLAIGQELAGSNPSRVQMEEMVLQAREHEAALGLADVELKKMIQLKNRLESNKKQLLAETHEQAGVIGGLRSNLAFAQDKIKTMDSSEASSSNQNPGPQFSGQTPAQSGTPSTLSYANWQASPAGLNTRQQNNRYLNERLSTDDFVKALRTRPVSDATYSALKTAYNKNGYGTDPTTLPIRQSQALIWRHKNGMAEQYRSVLNPSTGKSILQYKPLGEKGKYKDVTLSANLSLASYEKLLAAAQAVEDS